MGIGKFIKEEWEKTPVETEEERKKRKEEKKQKQEADKLQAARKEVENIIGESEEILYVYTFWNDKMIVTNKKLIYVDLRVAKNKTFAMIPFSKITSYSLLVPTGFSMKGKLKIFTGGDTPSLEIESALNEGINQFCKVLADII